MLECFTLLARVNNVTASDLVLMHQVVDTLQLGKTDNLVRRLDEATLVEVECLRGILTVADVAALDGYHLDDGLEDGRTEICASW